MKNWRELANRCLDISLVEVLTMLGGEQDKADKQKWHTSRGAVWLGKGQDRQKFFDHRTGRGGGGAIDLVMHLESCDFMQAVEMLVPLLGEFYHGQSSASKPETTKAAQATPFTPPREASQHLPKVVEYLSKVRGLSGALIAAQVERRAIYADDRRNVVFLCLDVQGHPTGAELRGTGDIPYKGMAPGSRRGAGFFTVGHAGPSQLVVVESAIDALSYHALFPHEPARVVSTAGVMPDCPELLALARHLGVPELVIAYDSDTAGNQASEALLGRLAGNGAFELRRRIPPAKDWNDALRNRNADPFGGAA